jgi:hypothetical protein
MPYERHIKDETKGIGIENFTLDAAPGLGRLWRKAARILRAGPRAAGWRPAAGLAVLCWGGPWRQAEQWVIDGLNLWPLEKFSPNVIMR